MPERAVRRVADHLAAAVAVAVAVAGTVVVSVKVICPVTSCPTETVLTSASVSVNVASEKLELTVAAPGRDAGRRERADRQRERTCEATPRTDGEDPKTM